MKSRLLCTGIIVMCALCLSPALLPEPEIEPKPPSVATTPPQPLPAPIESEPPVATPVPTPTSAPTPTPTPTVSCEPKFTEDDIVICAKVLYGEAIGCSEPEQELVVWCICNRVDSEDPYFPDSVEGVATQAQQFHGYSATYPVLPELYEVAKRVLEQWSAGEQALVYEPYATSPDYLYFSGNKAHTHNWFREEY